MADIVFSGKKVLTPQGLRPADVWVAKGIIERVSPPGEIPSSIIKIDCGKSVLMPALIDTHVHVNEPGRSDWEGFQSATKAAAAGGIGTIVDMPLNSIPVTTTVAAFTEKLRSAKGKLWVDVGFWGGYVGDNLGELEPMIKKGVIGFKAFLIYSGIDEFPAVGEKQLLAAMKILARHKTPLLAHAEIEKPLEGKTSGDSRKYQTFLESRPKAWENEAVRLLSRLALETGCRVHIVHLSSGEALEIIVEAAAKGAAITAETCPHYLLFAAEEIAEGATQFKCCPPIRDRANRELLWQGLREGIIDFIVSDHSPCPGPMKLPEKGDFIKAWGGIASIQFSFSALWSEASKRGFKMTDILRWMVTGPAKLAGLDRTKGRIAAGYDADLILWNPDAQFTPEESHIYHKHSLTPYLGRKLQGEVTATYVRAQKVFECGQFFGPYGKMLTAFSAPG